MQSVIAMNPKSETMRTAMPSAAVARFLQGRKDPSTLLGTIEFLDQRVADLEQQVRDLLRGGV